MLGRWERFGELCDIGDELTDEAYSRFTNGHVRYRCHRDTLVHFDKISAEQVRACFDAKTAVSALGIDFGLQRLSRACFPQAPASWCTRPHVQRLPKQADYE